MKQFPYTVLNPVGLHARPASLLIVKARSYRSNIQIEKEGKRVDLKNLMALLALNSVEMSRL